MKTGRRNSPQIAAVAGSMILSTASAEVSLSLSWAPHAENNIVGYRVHYGTESGNYTASLDAGNSTAITLSGLESGEVYYCSLSAYNIFGLESPKSIESVFIAESLSTQVVLLEAEDGTLEGDLSIGLELDPVTFQPSVNFIDTLQTSEPGSAVQAFQAANPGPYAAWLRVKAADHINDQLAFSVNSSGSPAVFDLYEDSDAHNGDWTWVRLENASGFPETFSVAAGQNTCLIEKVSPNIQIDRILLTSSFDFVPSVDLLSDEDFIQITRQPESVSSLPGHRVSLSVGVLSTEIPEYQWFKDGQPLDGATASILTLDQVSVEQEGSYSVEVSTPSGSTTSEAAVVSVLPSLRLTASNLDIDLSGEAPVVSMSIPGSEGMNLRLEASEDLLEWEELGQFSGGFPFSVLDPEAERAQRRFYRVVSIPTP